jgi:hypothetical protein
MRLNLRYAIRATHWGHVLETSTALALVLRSTHVPVTVGTGKGRRRRPASDAPQSLLARDLYATVRAVSRLPASCEASVKLR